MSEASRRVRRRHSAALRAQILGACAEPGASVARIALEHGINANVVHRWRRLATGRPYPSRAQPALTEFVPVPLGGSTPMVGDIRIELRRGATTVAVVWPVAAASVCSSWLRDLLG